MTKIVINTCFGGFGLSDEAEALYMKIKGVDKVNAYRLDRDDPVLVNVVESLGYKAEGPSASLAVVEVPDGVEWHISEYDGNENVAENHRTWS